MSINSSAPLIFFFFPLSFIAGTALWLLKRYEELAGKEEDSGLTTLQLLAKMPSTFKSQTQMGTFNSFIYPRKSLPTLSRILAFE